MATVKASLKAARESLQRQEFLDAIRHGKAALKIDSDSYDALVLLGKAAFQLGEHGQAEAAYRRAVTVNPSSLLAWKGLSELFTSQGAITSDFIETQEKLLELSEGVEASEKRQGYKRVLAKAYASSGQLEKAILHLQELLRDDSAAAEICLELLCSLADAQLALGARGIELAGGRDAVSEIVGQTVASPRFAAYHKAYSDRLWAQCQDSGWSDDMCREAAVTCQRLIRRSTSSRPLQTLLKLQLRSSHDPAAQEAAALTARKLAHQFPESPLASVGLGLTLYQSLSSDCAEPSTSQQRSLILQLLERGDLAAAGGLPQAWLAKARMQLQSCNHSGALETATQGLKLLLKQQQQQQLAAESPVSADEDALTELRLIIGICLLSQGQAERAVTALKQVAGNTAKPGATQPTVLQRRALAGLARAAAASGDREAARQLHARVLGNALTQQPPSRSAPPAKPAANSLAAFEHILGAAALAPKAKPVPEATPPDAEHWAHGDYGWFLFEEGDYKGAGEQLQKAEAFAADGDFEVADWEVAQHRWRLGRAHWELAEAAGQRGEAARKAAAAMWLQAAAVEGPQQAPAFAWLGRSYLRSPAGVGPARRCFQRALSIDPCLAMAGDALMGLLRKAGAAAPAAALCREIAAQYPEAAWAHVQLGLLLLGQGYAEEAVPALQAGIRGYEANARAWEGLGSAYQALDRLTAATKAYAKALGLDPARLYSLVQSSTIYLALGAYSDALASAEAALKLDPRHVPARTCAAAALLCSARSHVAMGAPGIAADDLEAAERHLASCLAGAGNLEAALKLLGDVRLCAYSAPPLDPMRALKQPVTAREHLDAAVKRWQRQISAMQAARRAYARALHAAPQRGAHWGDLAAALQLEAQLRRAHSRMAPEQAPRLRSLAERMLRGGLRLAPASADLWACLGACAGSPAAREYALSRALTLDPKQAPNWAALGRLYVEAGQPLLAERCLAAARSHDPGSAATWEAMGSLAALSPQGLEERGDLYSQAVKLGGGPEALMGLVEGTLRAGRPCHGTVYAAARRCAEAQPLDAAAWNALGRVEEQRGSFLEAASAYERAEALLADSPGGTTNGNACTEDCIMQSHPASDILHDLLAAVRLNLAHAHVRAGQPARAVGQYGQLVAGGQMPERGDLPERAADWVSFGQALAGSGQPGQAESAFQRAMSPAAPIKVQLAALQGVCKLRIQQGDVRGLLQRLDDSFELLVSAESSHDSAAAHSVWLTVLAAAALPGYASARGKIHSRVQTWKLLAGGGSAEFTAQQHRVTALGMQAAGDDLAASRELMRALRLCPWLIEVRVALACCVLRISPERHISAGRLIRSELVERLIRRPPGEDGESGAELIEQAMIARTTAALTASTDGSALSDVHACAKVLSACMHMHPHRAAFPGLAAPLLARIDDPCMRIDNPVTGIDDPCAHIDDPAGAGRAASAVSRVRADALRRRAAALQSGTGSGMMASGESFLDTRLTPLLSAAG